MVHKRVNPWKPCSIVNFPFITVVGKALCKALPLLISLVNLSLLHHRIIVPLFKMLDMLLSNGCFDMFAKEER